MMEFFRRIFSSSPSAIDELPACAVLGLDKARMILANAAVLNDPDDIKRSMGRALEEIESVFQLAKQASAELQGTSHAE